MAFLKTDACGASHESESTRRSALVVASWCLAIFLLPPNGLLWQFGAFDTLGHFFWECRQHLFRLHAKRIPKDKGVA